MQTAMNRMYPTMQAAQQAGAVRPLPSTYNVTSMIKPRNIYDQNTTAQYANQNAAQAQQNADPYQAAKMFDRPGISRGRASQALIAPFVAGGQLGAANAYANIPFQDAQANAQHMLRGQIAREGDAQQWAGTGMGMWNENQALQQMQQQQAMQILQSFLV